MIRKRLFRVCFSTSSIGEINLPDICMQMHSCVDIVTYTGGIDSGSLMSISSLRVAALSVCNNISPFESNVGQKHQKFNSVAIYHSPNAAPDDDSRCS